jgi:hypothetical protein
MQELGYMKTLPQEAGFDYSNCLRNKALLNNVGMGLKTNVQNMKTGTTICGLIYKVSDFVELTKNLIGRCCSRCRHSCHWWLYRWRQEL